MILNSNINVAVRCENCGTIGCYDLALFDIKNKELRLHCTCGAEKLSIMLENKTVQISIPCDLCGKIHVYRYGLKELLRKKDRVEICPNMGTNLLWIGSEEEVGKEVFLGDNIKEKNDNAHNFFNNPKIMMDILEWLYGLKGKGHLNCECGSEGKDIGINLFSDRVELYCKNCKGLSVIYAETEEDLKNLLNTNTILIHEKSFACIDAINFNGDINNK